MFFLITGIHTKMYIFLFPGPKMTIRLRSVARNASNRFITFLRHIKTSRINGIHAVLAENDHIRL